jgi:hypothetical protein
MENKGGKTSDHLISRNTLGNRSQHLDPSIAAAAAVRHQKSSSKSGPLIKLNQPHMTRLDE